MAKPENSGDHPHSAPMTTGVGQEPRTEDRERHCHEIIESEPEMPIKQEHTSNPSDIFGLSELKPSSGTCGSTGLLDKIAGYDRLLPKDSGRDSYVQDLWARGTPRTIKVKAKGTKRGREEKPEKNDGKRTRKKTASILESRNEGWRDTHQTTNEINKEIVDNGKQRKIRPRNSLQGWNSTGTIYPGHRFAITPPYEQGPSAPRDKSDFGRKKITSESDKRGVASVLNHESHVSFTPVQMPFFHAPPLATFHAVFPPAIMYDPTLNPFSRTSWNSREVELLESLPYVDQEVAEFDSSGYDPSGHRHTQQRPADSDDDEIVYLGEKRSFTTMNYPGAGWPTSQAMSNHVPLAYAPEEQATWTKPSISEKMNEVVNLLLVAAEVLDMNEVNGMKREESVSTGDRSSVERAMSPPIPMSLSPLYTLARLSTERLKTEGFVDQPRSHGSTKVAGGLPARKPSSVWIRGGHRSTNKDSLDNKNKKPYGRPPRDSSSKHSDSSNKLEWYTDFPEFERQAATKKSSVSGRGGTLSQTGSLSDMPFSSVKKVTFNLEGVEEAENRKTKSASKEAKGDPQQGFASATQPIPKGRPNSSSPMKRRGRPRKAIVAAEEPPAPPKTPRRPRAKKEESVATIMTTKTRSGRVVKAVQY